MEEHRGDQLFDGQWLCAEQSGLGEQNQATDRRSVFASATELPRALVEHSVGLLRHLESGDFRHYKVGIQGSDVVLDADGTFRIYAATEDPGTINWITTQGNTNGQILIRTLLADPLMEATFKVIKAADVPAADRRPE